MRLAWLVGMAIRHNVVATEGVDTHATTRRLERASDLVIVVAYVISVALYLRILAQFVVGYVSSGPAPPSGSWRWRSSD